MHLCNFPAIGPDFNILLQPTSYFATVFPEWVWLQYASAGWSFRRYMVVICIEFKEHVTWFMN